MIDVNRARAETPASKDGIYLNNAGCSLMPQPVIDAVQGYFALEARVGGYSGHGAGIHRARCGVRFSGCIDQCQTQ